MAQARSGGGINSRVVSNVKAPKAEPTSYAVTPGRASTIGQSVYFHKGPLQTQGGAYSNPIGPSDNMGQGPGANRVTLPHGTQGQHGSSVGGQPRPGSGKPIFPGFR
jgi:hypothetical protein